MCVDSSVYSVCIPSYIYLLICVNASLSLFLYIILSFCLYSSPALFSLLSPLPPPFLSLSFSLSLFISRQLFSLPGVQVFTQKDGERDPVRGDEDVGHHGTISEYINRFNGGNSYIKGYTNGERGRRRGGE